MHLFEPKVFFLPKDTIGTRAGQISYEVDDYDDDDDDDDYDDDVAVFEVVFFSSQLT